MADGKAGFIKEIREKVPDKEDRLVKKCEKSGCFVKLDSFDSQNYLVIDMDCPKPLPEEGKRCDYLFVGYKKKEPKVFIVPLELKSGKAIVSEVSEQLQAGPGLLKI